jgi:hypothetical protein
MSSFQNSANQSSNGASALIERIENTDWDSISDRLDDQGFATINSLLTFEECEKVIDFYHQESRFRKRIVMEQHQYGQGEYQYFDYPLPPIAQTLREALYPRLVPTANRWHQALGFETQFPDQLTDFLEDCHAAGQTRPTPLLLKYETGGFNCLHQDLYGDRVFPLQVAILLSEPWSDFTGGEFVLTEQKPRAQAQVRVLNMRQGDAAIFAVNQRPVRGSRGFHRVVMKHGVSPLHGGQRYCLGIIFHDAA